MMNKQRVVVDLTIENLMVLSIMLKKTHGHHATFNFFGPLIIGDDSMDLMDRFNKDSWHVEHGIVEESLGDAKELDKFQFMRNGYFSVDHESKKDHLVFNEIVPLKSSYK